MSLNLDRTNLVDNILIITNDDGSTTCIPKDDANEDELALFTEFTTAYPDGKPSTVSLAEAQASKNAELVQAYDNALAGGFSSSASGTSVSFAYNETSQSKFMKLLLTMNAGLITYPVSVYDVNGAIVQYTETQLKQLFTDLTAFEFELETKLHTLLLEVSSATTVDAVDAIVWGD